MKLSHFVESYGHHMMNMLLLLMMNMGHHMMNMLLLMMTMALHPTATVLQPSRSLSCWQSVPMRSSTSKPHQWSQWIPTPSSTVGMFPIRIGITLTPRHIVRYTTRLYQSMMSAKLREQFFVPATHKTGLKLAQISLRLEKYQAMLWF